MNNIIKYLKVLVIPIGGFVLIPLVISLFNIFGMEINKIVLIIISSIVLLITGFMIGIHSSKKGFINGLIVGLIFIMLLLLIGLIFGAKFKVSTIIYYLILLMCSVMGSILGINKESFISVFKYIINNTPINEYKI